MDDDAVKNFIPFRVSAEEPLFEVAMIMQLYPLDADRLVEVGNFYLRRVVRASRPLADREAIAAPLHLLRDGVPLVEIASDGMQLTA